MATHKCSGANLPCTLTADCKNNKVCSPIEDTDNPGTLVLRCKDPVAVGGSGEACTSNTECRTGACGANKLCFWACTKPEDCGASGWTCADTEVTVNGIKLAVKSCKSQPISGACVYDTDCPNAGDVCSLTVAQDGNSLVSACRTPVGTIEGGDPCAKDADCRSGVCLNTGVCFKHCATGSDCKGTNQLCEEMTFTFGTADAPKEQKVKGCNTQTQYCKSDADCTSNPNLSCHPSVANDGDNFLSPQCLLKVGDGIAGAACTTDADCRSGYCFTTAKLCYGICNSNTDCASGTKCYENMITFTFDQGTTVTTDDKYDSTSACVPDRGSWKLCTRDADCTSTEWCSPQPTKDSTKWEGRCAKRTGSIGPGGDCTADADCRSNFCIPPSQGVPPSSLNPGICFGMCSTSNDCVSIFSTCSSVDLTTHDRGTENDESDDLKAPLKVCL